MGVVPCDVCNGFGVVDCECGGDFCVCKKGTIPCPKCGGEKVLAPKILASFVFLLGMAALGLAAVVSPAEGAKPELQRQPTMLWTWVWDGERGEQMCGPTHTCFGYTDITDMAMCDRVVKSIIRNGNREEQEQFFCGYIYRQQMGVK